MGKRITSMNRLIVVLFLLAAAVTLSQSQIVTFFNHVSAEIKVHCEAGRPGIRIGGPRLDAVLAARGNMDWNTEAGTHLIGYDCEAQMAALKVEFNGTVGGFIDRVTWFFTQVHVKEEEFGQRAIPWHL